MNSTVLASQLLKLVRSGSVESPSILLYSFLRDVELLLTAEVGEGLVSPGGEDSHMKQTGMLVVSLRGVNFGFWSRLGCPAQSANILRR